MEIKVCDASLAERQPTGTRVGDRVEVEQVETLA